MGRLSTQYSVAAMGAPAGQPATVPRLNVLSRDRTGQRMLTLVAESTGVPVDQLLHQSRCESGVAIARQLAMYLMNVALERSFTDVGEFFGRDRTTVSHACSLIEDMRDDPLNPDFERSVVALEAAIRAPASMPQQAELRHAAG